MSSRLGTKEAMLLWTVLLTMAAFAGAGHHKQSPAASDTDEGPRTVFRECGLELRK